MTNTRWLAMTLILLVAMLCAGFATVLVAISVARAPGFLQILTTPYNQILDYAFDLDHGARIIAGTARSMGITVEG